MHNTVHQISCIIEAATIIVRHHIMAYTAQFQHLSYNLRATSDETYGTTNNFTIYPYPAKLHSSEHIKLFFQIISILIAFLHYRAMKANFLCYALFIRQTSGHKIFKELSYLYADNSPATEPEHTRTTPE